MIVQPKPTAKLFPVLLPMAAIVSLAACAEPIDQNRTDLDIAETEEEAEVLATSFEAGDFMDLELGAKIVGPQGPEVKTTLSNKASAFADITSYVACPAGMEECDPATAPEGTIYTYVHTVFPGEDNDAETGSGTGNDSSDIESAVSFQMTQPAHGFTGNAGYSFDALLAAVGPKAEAAVTCLDGGIAWIINAGDGGNQWEQAEPITFYWQSTLPPAGPADAYAIDADYTVATGSGPYPAASDSATNACMAELEDDAAPAN